MSKLSFKKISNEQYQVIDATFRSLREDQLTLDEPMIVKWCLQGKRVVQLQTNPQTVQPEETGEIELKTKAMISDVIFQKRIVVCSRFRFLTFKSSPFKILQLSKNLPFIDLESLHVEKQTDGQSVLLRFQFHGQKEIIVNAGAHSEDYVRAIQRVLLQVFDAFPTDLKPKLKLPIDYNWEEYSTGKTLQHNAEHEFEQFTHVYKAYCDYFRIPYRPNVVEYFRAVSSASEAHRVVDFQVCFQQSRDPQPDSRDVQAIIKALQCFSMFECVRICDYDVKNMGLITLFNSLQYNLHLHSLVLQKICLTKDSLDVFRRSAEIQTDLLIQNEKELEQSMVHEQGLGLKCLDLSENYFNKEMLQVLAQTFKAFKKGMQALHLRHCKLNPRLVTILFSSIRSPNWGSSLLELSLSHNNLGKEGTLALVDWISCSFALQHLELEDTQLDTTRFVSALQLNRILHKSSLKHLNLSLNRMSDDGGKGLAQILLETKSLGEMILRSVQITKRSLEAIFRAMLRNSTEKLGFAIDLSNNDLSGSKGKLMAHLLEEYPMANLQDIILNHCRLGVDDSLLLVIRALENYPSLRLLSLQDNPSILKYPSLFRDDTIPSRTGESLAALLAGPPQSLSMTNAIVATHSTIQELNLSADQMGYGVDVLLPAIQALSGNQTLQVLDIHGNFAGDVIAFALEKVLAVNNSLKALYWDNNRTTCEGFLAFKKGLEKNHSLVIVPVPIQDTREILEKRNPPREELFGIFGEIYKLIERNQLSAHVTEYSDENQAAEDTHSLHAKVESIHLFQQYHSVQNWKQFSTIFVPSQASKNVKCDCDDDDDAALSSSLGDLMTPYHTVSDSFFSSSWTRTISGTHVRPSYPSLRRSQPSQKTKVGSIDASLHSMKP